jgi:hypothetical protein
VRVRVRGDIARSFARRARLPLLLSATAEERDKLLLAKIRSGIEPAWTDDDDAHEAEPLLTRVLFLTMTAAFGETLFLEICPGF